MAESIILKYLVIFIISCIILDEPVQSIDQTPNSTTTPSNITDIGPKIISVSSNGHQLEKHENSTNSTSLSNDIESEHKRRVIDSSLYSGKRLLLTDRLYKLNVYLDPICEQIDTLTSKQLTRVALQFRQFISHTNGRLGKCVESQFKHDPSEYPITREQLREICHSKETERYKFFEICAIKNWNVLIDLELDRIIDNRIKCGLRKQKQLSGQQQNGTEKDSNTMQQLHDDEKLLIDDIVNHMHRHNRHELYSLLMQDIPRENNSVITVTNSSNEIMPNIELSTKDNNSQSIITNLFKDITATLDKNVTAPEKRIEKEPYIELKNISLPISTGEIVASNEENATKIEVASPRSSNSTDQQNIEKPVINLKENLSEDYSNNSTPAKLKVQESEKAAALISTTKSPFYDVHNDVLTSSAPVTSAPLAAESLPESSVEVMSTGSPLDTTVLSPHLAPPVSPLSSHPSADSNSSVTPSSSPDLPTLHEGLAYLTTPNPPMDPVASSLAPPTPPADTVPPTPTTTQAPPASTTTQATPAPLAPPSPPEPSIAPEDSAQPAHLDNIPQVPQESVSNVSAIPTTTPTIEVEGLLNRTMEQLSKLENVTSSIENRTAGMIETVATTKSPEAVDDITITKQSVPISNSSSGLELEPANGSQNVTLSSNSLNQTITPPSEAATGNITDARSSPASPNVLIELEGLPTKPVNDYLKLIEQRQIEHSNKVANGTESDHHLIGPKLTVDSATHQSKAHLEIPLSNGIYSGPVNQASNRTTTNVTASHIQQQNSNSSDYHHAYNKKIIMKVKIDPDKLARGELPTKEVKKSLLNHGVDAKTVDSIIENISPAKSTITIDNSNSTEATLNLTVADNKSHTMPNETIKLNVSESFPSDRAEQKQPPAEELLLLPTNKTTPNTNSSQPPDRANIHQATIINAPPFISDQYERPVISNPKHITKVHKTSKAIEPLVALPQTVHTNQNSRAPHEVVKVNPIIHSGSRSVHIPVAQTQPASSHPIPYANHLISHRIPVQQKTMVAQKTVPGKLIKTIKKMPVDPKSTHKVTISQQIPKRSEIIPRIQPKQPHFVPPHVQPLHPLSPFLNHHPFPLNGFHYQNDPNNFQIMSHNPVNSMNFPPFHEYGAAFDPNMHAFSGLPHQPQMNFMMPPSSVAGPQHETSPVLRSNRQMINNLHRTDGDLHNMEHARQMLIDPIGHTEKHRISEITIAQRRSRGVS